MTAGTLTMVPAGAGMSTVLLTGTDGATYTYRDVRASVARRTKVAAGARIGASGPRGVTFSVSVPDVRGAVDAAQALQAWATGLSVNVRALPSTIEPATPPKRAEALLVTDAEPARRRPTWRSPCPARWSRSGPRPSATPVPPATWPPRHGR